MERSSLSTGLRRLAIGLAVSALGGLLASLLMAVSESLDGAESIITAVLAFLAAPVQMAAIVISLAGVALLSSEHHRYRLAFAS